MAKVFPDGWRQLEATGSAARELQTLAQLAAGLDDGYTVYHGVHWTRIDRSNYAIVGEIDFAIVGLAGKVLLVEQKAGVLTETAGGLVKKYADKQKDVAVQMARSAEAFHARLRAFCKGEQTFVDSLLYCPDYTVRQPGTVGIDPARIVDATRKDALIPIIRSILPASDPVLPAKDKVHRFLRDVLELVPEVNAVVGEAQSLYTRLSGGLAYWARQIDAEPFRLRVIGTAGSGKTQLAMAVYRDALRAGRRPLYVCYNRPLADHIALIAPAGGEVTTYHQLADRVSRAQGETPDFSQPGAYARLEAVLDGHTPAEAERVDELIIDEGQDFHERWAANLLRFLRPGGRAWWLEDPMQNLYGREGVKLAGWVSLRSAVNYRSPKEILDTLNRLLPLEHPVEAGSPLSGMEVDIVSYTDPADMIAKTVSAVTRCVGLGFKREHIALITYRGRESSRFTPFDRLGPYTLRAPTGQYDLLGNALYTEGDLLVDSVHRFKGRAAPCVVFTEIDFESLDDAAVRRIFVGATRATMKLTLVVSERSARVLLERMGER
ncbi:MAG TPA: ATP-binding domain-containing protein [Thermoleophilia bacterium]|nr:ATP-binding domain-containing protein [Thermoleophilia bacterium]